MARQYERERPCNEWATNRVRVRPRWEGDMHIIICKADWKAGSRLLMQNMSSPRLVFWELTRGCNLRCIHCRATATELCSPDDLNTAECERIIDELAQFAPLILVLSGGEPLYRKDVLQLARRATDRGIRVALATNGTLVTPELAAQIRDAGDR